jgi:hypothetical protein
VSGPGAPLFLEWVTERGTIAAMGPHVLRKVTANPPAPRDMCKRCGMVHSQAIDLYDCIDFLRSPLAMFEQRRENSLRKRKV